MKPYSELSREELKALHHELKVKYKKAQDLNLNLNMARGKPSIAQLDLSMGMMDVLNSDSDLRCEDGTDCRNYGVMDGIPASADGGHDGSSEGSSDYLREQFPERDV